MPSQKALQIQGPGVAELVTDVSIPKVRDDYIIVRTRAVALNPTDWKHIDFLPTKGAIVGCDYAGVVEQVGKNVTKFRKGDRVAGMVHGSNVLDPKGGAFAEYIIARAAVAAKIPDGLTYAKASTLGVGITTVGQALYQSLGLELPTKPVTEKIPLLIYGGSTATGTLAIQFAKLSGYEVITTASPHNNALLRSLGADHVIDYNAPDAAAQIRAITNDQLRFVLDCISEGNSPQICSDAISSAGGIYLTLLRSSIERTDVENKVTLAYTAIGVDVALGPYKVPAKPEDLEFASMFWDLTAQLLAERKIKPHPAKVVEGGLETLLDSLKNLKEGKASGFKYVHLLD